MYDSINLGEAFLIGLEAVKKANSLKTNVSVSVINKYGTQIFFCKMDNALPISEKMAFKKAHTSMLLQMPTEDVKKSIDESWYGLDTAMKGEIVMFGGGVPVFRNNEFVGAVGVSGSRNIEDDVLIAKTAAQVINN